MKGFPHILCPHFSSFYLYLTKHLF